MKITENIKYIGVDDHTLDLFEGQYIIPNGISYNSYIIFDEKIAIMDCVDKREEAQWLANLTEALAGKTPDYLIVHHMEPDHSGCIGTLLEKYPNLQVVTSSMAVQMLSQFFCETDFTGRIITVKEGDTLSLGKHTLEFIMAPMVHWPEVFVSYEQSEKILFSADAFGKFGALSHEEEWACEARRYYFGIVGKYGAQTQALLKKAAALDVEIICPLHGPVLKENLDYYLNLYSKWSAYEPEEEGVVIAYTSVYGNTKKAVLKLAEAIEAKGIKVVVNDLARCDMAEAVEDAFRYNRLVLATTTYNSDVFPFMKEFINHLTERGYRNRKIGFVENGSWAPVATKVMLKMLEGSKNLTYCENTVKILSALNAESEAQLNALAEEMSE